MVRNMRRRCTPALWLSLTALLGAACGGSSSAAQVAGADGGRAVDAQAGGAADAPGSTNPSPTGRDAGSADRAGSPTSLIDATPSTPDAPGAAAPADAPAIAERPPDTRAADGPPTDARALPGDVGTSREAGGPGAMACAQPTDCAGLARPATAPFCAGSAWSCIDRRCVWDCEGNRTCATDAQGCTTCPPAALRTCRDAACTIPARARFESGTCGQAALPSSCAGAFAWLPDGTPCTIVGLATGLVRWAVSCGTCQSVFVLP
jgi:hypothetical protein